MDTPSTPAERIKWLMNQYGFEHQRDLAQKLKCHESTISKNLSEKSKATNKFIDSLVRKLNWSGDWIKTGIGTPQIVYRLTDEQRAINQLSVRIELLEAEVQLLKVGSPQQFPK